MTTNRESVLDSFEQSQLLKGLNPTTCNQTRNNIRAWFAWKDETKNTGAGPELMIHWLNELRADGASPAQLKAKRYALKAYCEWAGWDMKFINSYRLPPATPQIPHPIPEGMTAIRRMLDTAVDCSVNSTFLVALQGLAGLRVTEARLLRREDIDAVRNEIVVKGKGEKTRRIPISKELGAYIDAMPDAGRLVNLSDAGARAAITRIAKMANVDSSDGSPVTSHDLRATFATAVYEKTKDILLVSRLLGHASVVTTQVYLGLGTETLKDAVEL